MGDDRFHEIQLSGKQLVFLFMATLVVVVVIFLAGVMVGRGVRVQKAAADAVDLAVPAFEPGAAASPAGSSNPIAETSKPAGTKPDRSGELSYYTQLEGQSPAQSVPKIPSPAAGRSEPAVSERVPPEAVREVVPNTSAAGEKRAPAPIAAGSQQASADRFYALQVAALRDRPSAETVLKRLVAKGYEAYILDPATGASPVFRVRVGRYKTRREADEVKRQLEKDKYKPLIMR